MASAPPAASPSSSNQQQQLMQPSAVATTLLQRRVMARQRFDSADFAMSKQQKAKAAAVGAPPSSPQSERCHDQSATSSDVELDEEPEPEHLDSLGSLTAKLKIGNSEAGYSHQQQQVRRIRLQRFDSADWMLHGSPAQWLSPRSRREQGPPVSVAQQLLDRHAYTTCHFMSTA